MNILVTGATGFIGHSFIKEISDIHRIFCLVRESSNYKSILKESKNITVVKSQIVDIHSNETLKETVFDIVYHFAWGGVRGNQRNEEEIQKNNYNDSLNIVRFVIDNKIKKLVMLGSQEEFSNSKNIDQNTTTNPETQYGYYKDKIHRDTQLLSHEYNFDLYWLRVFSVYGEGDYKNSLIQDSIRKMKSDEVVNLIFGQKKWDFLYIDDLLEILKIVMEPETKPGEYNIAFGESKTLSDFLYILKELLNSSSNILIIDNETIDGIEVDIDYTIKCLNWRPKYNFKEGIIKMLKINII